MLWTTARAQQASSARVPLSPYKRRVSEVRSQTPALDDKELLALSPGSRSLPPGCGRVMGPSALARRVARGGYGFFAEPFGYERREADGPRSAGALRRTQSTAADGPPCRRILRASSGLRGGSASGIRGHRPDHLETVGRNATQARSKMNRILTSTIDRRVRSHIAIGWATLLVLAVAQGSLAVPQALAAAAPTATTGAAQQVQFASATVTGTVNPNGSATTYYFEYGPTAAYGMQTSATSAGAGTADVVVPQPLSGLASSTTYHYRLVAVSAGGTVVGGDLTV